MTGLNYKMENRFTIILLLSLAFGLAGCGPGETEGDPIIKGQITVDPELDPSGDYSGIELLIAETSVEGSRDTLFHSVTDSTGAYNGVATIDERRLYPLLVSRNNQQLGLLSMVLADGDTIKFNGQLPNIDETATIESYENNMFEKYERVQRSFQRVVNYVNSRGMSTDSVESEILKWSDLFWDLYQETPDTYAGERAAATSTSILQGWDNDLMLARKDSILNRYDTLPSGLRSQLTEFYATRDSLEQSVAFLNQVEDRLDDNEKKMAVRQEKIKLLYDSSRTERAAELLADFRQTYSGNQMAIEWADRTDYDITTLASGKPFPVFSFQNNEGQTVSLESLRGTPFMIEFTRLDNPLYQQQYDRVLAIHQVYRNFGLEILTVPIGASDVVLNAFLDERAKYWDFIDPESFYVDELVVKYNLNRLPTRFLVNDQGNIVQRYVGTEFDRIVEGLQQTLTQQQTEP